VNWSQLPNLISVGRILLVGPVAWSLVTERYTTTLLLFTVAGVSDALDGFLAKRYGWTSRLGSLLDPLADKLLLVTVFVLMTWVGMLPGWLVALALLREVVILGGAFAYHRLFGPFAGEPTPASKVNTFLQIALVIAVLIERAAMPLPAGTVEWLVIAVAASVLVSGVQYVWVWSRRAQRAARERR
jgi:cardiolipin synthase